MKELELYKKFLNYLSSKEKAVSYGEIMKDLNLDKAGLEKLFGHMSNYYDNAGHEKGKEDKWEFHLVEINHKGVEYLRSLDIQEVVSNQSRFNRVIALTGCIIAFVTLWNFVNSYLHQSSIKEPTPFNIVSFIIGIIIIMAFSFLLGSELGSLYFKKKK